MTNTESFCRHRDPVSAAFAAALDGEVRAECELRELAVHHDRAADALCALAYSEAIEDPRPVSPANVAATDQMIAAVFEAVAGTAHRTRGELVVDLVGSSRPGGQRPSAMNGAASRRCPVGLSSPRGASRV